MTQPLFFDPDPHIPDSDLLGFGDMIYGDGRREYLNGDDEIAAQLQRYQPEPQADMPQGPAAPLLPGSSQPGQFGPPLPPGVKINMDGTLDMGGAAPDMTGVQDPQTGELYDPGDTSNMLPALGGEIANAAKGYPEKVGSIWDEKMGGGSPIEPLPPDMAPPKEPLMGNDGQAYQVSQTGMLEPFTPDDGMRPVQREGALPPDVAQRQLSELGGMQDENLALAEQARADEARIVREANLKEMARLEAQQAQREREIAEEQEKVARWQTEQQEAKDMEVDRSLTGALGPLGAAMAVIGSALLGGTGSDAGLRMIDRSIDRHVNEQVKRRETTLGLLAEKIGSSQQAIKMGKAEVYKILGDRTELLAQKTKNDVFEAQSPAFIGGLRQKQMENMQEAERLSLGKTLEKVTTPKPPSEEMLNKYGQLRRERDGSSNIASRVEQQIGLQWAPGKDGQPGHYQNRDEVLKNGIQGIGNLEQWLPDAVYSTMGGTTAEGYQVRGAAEAMAFAQIRQMQPTGPISNADIQAAVKAGALNTEDGMLRALERIRTTNEQQEKHDAAQFGPDLVQEYNRRYRQSGGQTMTTAPAASSKASLQDIRGALDQQPQGQPGASTAQQMTPDQRMSQVAEDLMAMGGEKQLPPKALDILIAQAAHESGNGDSEGAAMGNLFGHKATQGRKAFDAMTTEGEGAGARRLKQRFAAYDTIADSVADHLSLLERRYPRAWEALINEDEAAYVAALKDGGYFTGNEAAYLRRIQERL